MRIRLKKGRQKELIFSAKGNLTWKELAYKTGISEQYLCRDLKNETVLLSEEDYDSLCNISNKYFDNFITEKLVNNWGKIKGGKNSKGSTIKLKVSDNKEALSEFIGIVLGDGNINFYKKGKKIGVYQIKVAGDYEKDREYHLNYIKPLSEALFNLKAKEIIIPKRNERFLFWSSKELVEFFMQLNLPSGNKIKNQITIPKWIIQDNQLLKKCIRGLIDTDGSIFRMSQKNPKLLRISFTNYNRKLLNDVKKSFEILGFKTSKIINNKQIFISRKEDIEKYLKEIGFSNQKHIERLQKFKCSPVV